MSPVNVHVLLVEDDPGISGLYESALQLAGFQVRVVADGAAGLAAAAFEVPDIVLLDIILPELDGFDVLEKLKAHPRTATVPVLLLSNLSQPEQIERGRKLGAVGYFVKANHVPADIIVRINELCRGHRAVADTSKC